MFNLQELLKIRDNIYTWSILIRCQHQVHDTYGQVISYIPDVVGVIYVGITYSFLFYLLC